MFLALVLAATALPSPAKSWLLDTPSGRSRRRAPRMPGSFASVAFG
jgi:hypothetical protein